MLKYNKVCISGMIGVSDENLYSYKEKVETRCPGAQVDILTKEILSEDDAIRLMQGYDVLMSGYQEMTKKIYDQTDLKAFIVCSIGYNFVNLEEATKHGVVVANNPAYCVSEVAEHICAMILSLGRHIFVMGNAVKEGKWGFPTIAPQFRFSDSTVGFYGFGRIPKEAVRKLSGFGCRLITHDPYIDPAVAKAMGTETVSFDELAEQSDYLVVQVPLMPSTYGVFNADVFRKMKKTAFLINTARGQLVVQEDLYNALVNGEIAGVGLDVLENEPPKEEDRKLIALPNVICTGHTGFYSVESLENQNELTVANIIRVLNGELPENIVNREVLDKISW